MKTPPEVLAAALLLYILVRIVAYMIDYYFDAEQLRRAEAREDRRRALRAGRAMQKWGRS